MSPIVRRAAALSIPKCWKLDPNTAPQLEGYLGVLLGDRQYYVAGAAAMAMAECCPDRIDLMHGSYRGLVRKLVDMDEWSQLATLRLLTRYARKCFPLKRRRRSTTNDKTADNFYDDENVTGPSMVERTSNARDEHESVPDDPDLTSLLQSAQPLLHSRNSAVVLAVVRMYLSLTHTNKSSSTRSPSSYISSAIGPLVALLRSPPTMHPIALQQILEVALVYPRLFIRYTSRFLLRASDSSRIARLKLEIASLIFPHAPPNAQSLILAEIGQATRGWSSGAVPDIRRDAVYALGRCASASSAAGSMAARRRCMKLLLDLIGTSNNINLQQNGASPIESKGDPSSAAAALTVLRHLIQTDPSAHISTIIKLAKDLDATAGQPEARASILWLIGEYCSANNGVSAGGIDETRTASNEKGTIAADVLRILTKTFSDEEDIVKKQIVLLSAKVYLHYLNDLQRQHKASPEADQLPPQAAEGIYSTQKDQIPKLFAYIHSLVRYDTSYELRDLARTYRSLLPDPSIINARDTLTASIADANTQLATLLLLAPKPPPTDPTAFSQRQDFPLGSASGIVAADGGDALPGYEPLPEWVKAGDEPDPRLRDETRVDGGVDVGGQVPAIQRLGVQERGSMGDTHDAQGEVRVVKEKTLDDWLDEESAEEDEEEDVSTEEESEEETESEESSEEEDEGERGKLMR